VDFVALPALFAESDLSELAVGDDLGFGLLPLWLRLPSFLFLV
jgi:hypothetical protein